MTSLVTRVDLSTASIVYPSHDHEPSPLPLAICETRYQPPPGMLNRILLALSTTSRVRAMTDGYPSDTARMDHPSQCRSGIRRSVYFALVWSLGVGGVKVVFEAEHYAVVFVRVISQPFAGALAVPRFGIVPRVIADTIACLAAAWAFMHRHLQVTRVDLSTSAASVLVSAAGSPRRSLYHVGRRLVPRHTGRPCSFLGQPVSSSRAQFPVRHR